jgi:hypothetical protein
VLYFDQRGKVTVTGHFADKGLFPGIILRIVQEYLQEQSNGEKTSPSLVDRFGHLYGGL